MKVAEAVEGFMRGYFGGRRRVAKTAAAYRGDLNQFGEFAGGRASLSSVGEGLVRDWVQSLRRAKYSRASVRRKVATLRVFCSYWVRRGEMRESPFWRLDLKMRPGGSVTRRVEPAQMRKLATAARRSRRAALRRRVSAGRGRLENDQAFRALRDLAIVEVLCATGVRVGELCALDEGDFLSRAGGFKVGGVGGQGRVAYIFDERVLGVVREYLVERAAVDCGAPAMFVNAKGGRLSAQGVSNVLEGLRVAAGVRDRVTSSTLRNSVEAVMLERGVDLRVVFAQLGKKFGKTPAAGGGRVAPVSRVHLVRELRKLSPAAGLTPAV